MIDGGSKVVVNEIMTALADRRGRLHGIVAALL